MKIIFYLLLILQLPSCTQKKYDNPHVIIDTNYGEIELELFPKQAPKTVAAFLSYVDNGLYKNTSFYRVLKNEDLLEDNNYGIIQGGVYPNLKNVKPIEHETTKLTGLSHTNGTISFASLGAGTATTEFFICIGNQTSFDAGNNGTVDKQGFAAFGTVLKGMRIVRKIQATKNTGDHIDEKIIINNIERL
jgi:peptidyl-prolyl cis-trans isomerase A (cyclophilin A)